MNHKDQVAEELNNAKRRVENTMHDVTERVRESVDDARLRARDARDYITDRAHDAEARFDDLRGTLNDGIDRVRDMDREDYEEILEGFKDKVRENPGRTLMIAVGIGLAIGFMFRGNRR